jgi:hypothetical protein
MLGTMSESAPWERVGSRAHWRGATASAVAAAVWIGLALWRPTSTFHLAPALVTAAWPWLLRDPALPAGAFDARRATAGAAAIALVAAAVLLIADAMRGPTLWGSGHAMIEVVPAVALGGWFGYRRARCGPRFD